MHDNDKLARKVLGQFLFFQAVKWGMMIGICKAAKKAAEN